MFGRCDIDPQNPATVLRFSPIARFLHRAKAGVQKTNDDSTVDITNNDITISIVSVAAGAGGG